MIDLKGLTFAELCSLLHDVAEELAERWQDVLVLLNAATENKDEQEGIS